MKFPNPFDPKYWVMPEPEPAVVPGPKAVFQARCSAIALENDREQLREDLMRRMRENREESERIHAALDELDALRILEKAS
jgi:hypothetical protein